MPAAGLPATSEQPSELTLTAAPSLEVVLVWLSALPAKAALPASAERGGRAAALDLVGDGLVEPAVGVRRLGRARVAELGRGRLELDRVGAGVRVAGQVCDRAVDRVRAVCSDRALPAAVGAGEREGVAVVGAARVAGEAGAR